MNLFSTNVAYAGLDSFLANVSAQIINPAIELLFALAIVYFLYGVFEFIRNQDNEEKKTTGKSHMMWGLVGIAIMLGVWGILNLILNTLNISKSEIDPEAVKVDLKEYNPPNFPRVGN